MADIRINALPTTATDFASDDYIAIDGTTNGTRKLNAKTANLTFSDVTLGTSGPSVKSTLSARAPRQGLVFDGTAGTTVSVPAFGTSDFTIDAVANTNDATAANYIVAGITGSFYALSLGNGSLYFYKGGGTARNVAGVFTSKKTVRIAISKSSGVISTYVNGVLIDTWTDANDATGGYTQPISGIGGTSTQFWAGYLSVNIYNRALSASEVVALYEAGAPSGADYNSASNTSLSTSALTAFAPFTLYSTFSSANGTSFSASDASANRACATNASFSVSAGQKILVSFTLTQNGSDFPQVILCDPTGPTDSSNAVVSTAGANNITLTATRAGTVRVRFFSFAASNYSVANLSVTRLGLLLAPDAAQAGGGLVWYDTSGNAANITLPASGVSWNVPSSRVLGGNWTTSGTLTISGGQAVNIGSSANYNLWKDATPTKAGRVILNNTVTNGLSLGLYDGSSWVDTLHIHPTNNNVLIGGTIDSSNGNLQLKDTSGSSTKGIGFGTDTSLYRANTGDLYFSNSTNYQVIRIASGGTNQSSYIDLRPTGTGSGVLQVSGITALTLDSSQNATFAGTVKVKNQATLNANGNVAVSTSATTILSALNTSSANWAFVFGDNGTHGFADLVVTVGNGNAVAVISSATIYGSPPARTYTSSSANLQLAMASGTMSVRTSSLNNGT